MRAKTGAAWWKTESVRWWSAMPAAMSASGWSGASRAPHMVEKSGSIAPSDLPGEGPAPMGQLATAAWPK